MFKLTLELVELDMALELLVVLLVTSTVVLPVTFDVVLVLELEFDV